MNGTVSMTVPKDFETKLEKRTTQAMRILPGQLHENQYRRLTSKRVLDGPDFQLLVGNPPGSTSLTRRLDVDDGNWLFITISFDPKMLVCSGQTNKRYIACTYPEQLEACLRYYETVYFSYVRGVSYGSWELDSSGKLHVHILLHSEDKIKDTYVLNAIRHGVSTDKHTMKFTRGKRDYCNNIVVANDPLETLRYITKDHDRKLGRGLPVEKYFYHHIV